MRGLRQPNLGLPAAAGDGVAAAAGPNPNLLLWSEELQQAAWIKTNTAIAADDHLDPNGLTTTADHVTFTALSGKFEQTSDVAATVGAAATLTVALGGPFTRHAVSGTFDGTTYVYSFYTLDDGSGADIQARLERSGGFLMASLRDLGDGATFWAWGFKLETPTLTDYVKREGP